jgi:hypothetical protein
MSYNSQCGRIDRYGLEPIGRSTIIYLDAHPLAVDHLQLVLEARRIRLPVGHEWRQALVVIGPLPAWANDMLELLSEVVITQAGNAVNVALALDWYQRRTPADDGWLYTASGELVHNAKYEAWRFTPPELEAIERELAGIMASVMHKHVLYRGAAAILTTPSSILRNTSSAERTAAYLAEVAGLPLVRTTGNTPIRPQRKSGADFDLANEFSVAPTHVRGETVVIVDDLYKQGGTMQGVALAARRAGARLVLGLAGARTMGN